MIQLIATLVVVAGIVGLFFLDRDPEARTAKALWIPVIWMLLVCSRAVSEWADLDPVADVADRFREGSPLEASIYGILIVAGLLALNRRAYKVASFFRLNTPLVLFLLYCAVSTMWSDYPFVGIKRWIKGAGTLVMVLVLLTDSDPVAATRRLFSRSAFLLLPVSVLLIECFPKLGSTFDPWSKRTFYIGVTTQKNELGLTCLICGLGTLWSLIRAYEDRTLPHRVRHLIAHGVILATALWLLKKCDSMTSLSCLLIAGGVMLLMGQPWVRRQTSHVNTVVWGAVAVAIFAAFIDSSGALLGLLGRTSSLTGRTDVWKAVLSIHTNPLLGAGYESFWLGDRIEEVWRIVGFNNFAEAHNGYLEIYINLGWMGLIMLGVLFASGYRNALTSLRIDPLTGRLKMAFFGAALIFNLSEAGFTMMGPMWIAFLVAIINVPPISQSQVYQQPFKIPSAPGVPQKQIRILQ